MQNDNKNNSIIEDDDLWESITKNDKKYIKANRHVYKKLNSEKKINIIINQKNPLVTNTQVNKNNIKTGSTPVNKNRKIEDNPKADALINKANTKIGSIVNISNLFPLKSGVPPVTMAIEGTTQAAKNRSHNNNLQKTIDKLSVYLPRFKST